MRKMKYGTSSPTIRYICFISFENASSGFCIFSYSHDLSWFKETSSPDCTTVSLSQEITNRLKQQIRKHRTHFILTHSLSQTFNTKLLLRILLQLQYDVHHTFSQSTSKKYANTRYSFSAIWTKKPHATLSFIYTKNSCIDFEKIQPKTTKKQEINTKSCIWRAIFPNKIG